VGQEGLQWGWGWLEVKKRAGEAMSIGFELEVIGLEIELCKDLSYSYQVNVWV
jgi:hypothetical protein